MEFIDLKRQQKLIKKEILKSIEEVLSNGQYIQGPKIFELEKKLSNYVGAKFCVTCSSGTDALFMCLMAWNIKPGDLILTTPFTYIATSEVIRLIGAKPIFVDIDKHSFNIDPTKIEKKILELKKNNLPLPKVIIPVNIFGLCSDYDKIGEIANKYNIRILEDAAQSFGASYKNKKSCTFGDASATSFFPAKPLGCYGDGGAIFTSNKLLHEKLLSIRVHGSGTDKYDNIRNGINGRLDTIQAAVLLQKLKIFDDELKSRYKNYILYKKYLEGSYSIQKISNNHFSSFAQLAILAKNKKNRDLIMEKLRLNKIPNVIYYKNPLHLQKVNEDLGYTKGDLPISEDISNRVFSVPMHPYLKESEINFISSVLLKYKNHE